MNTHYLIHRHSDLKFFDCLYRVNSVQACRLKFGQGRKLVFG